MKHCLIYFCTVLLMAGCIDSISLETPETEQLLIIDGRITNAQDVYQVTIFTSSDLDFSPFGDLEPISGAEVQIKSLSGLCLSLTETAPGVYQTDGTFQGQIGEWYFVDVQVNEQVYTSEPDLLKPVPIINSLEYQLEERTLLNSSGNLITRKFVKILTSLDVPDVSEGLFLKWDVEGEFELREFIPGSLDNRTCYVKDNINLNNVSLLDGSLLSGSLNGLEIIELEVNNKFADRYCVHVIQTSISKQAFDYWQNVGEVLDRTGSLFETPPGRIKGNISNANNPQEEVLGIFYASAVDSMRLFLDGERIDVLRRCIARSMPFIEECDNCLIIPGASLERPPYWIP